MGWGERGMGWDQNWMGWGQGGMGMGWERWEEDMMRRGWDQDGMGEKHRDRVEHGGGGSGTGWYGDSL